MHLLQNWKKTTSRSKRKTIKTLIMKNPMFNIPYGLYVVTTNSEGKDNGCISNTVIQVTAEPNRISVALNKANLTTEMIAKSMKLTVSIISESASFDLFKHFGFQSGRDTNKFADFTDCKRLENGTMAITAGTNAYIYETVCKSIDVGTHIIFIAEVTEMEVISDDKTATYDYYQQNIKPKPQKPKKTIWRCRICGYEYEGEELPADFICPICKHPASDFDKIEV